MANVTIGNITGGEDTAPNAVTTILETESGTSGSPPVGTSKWSRLWRLIKAGLLMPVAASGAGADLTIKGQDAASGAGGQIVLEPGVHVTTGADGVVAIRKPGGTAGTDEVQISNNGTTTLIETKTSHLRLTAPYSGEIHLDTNGVNVYLGAAVLDSGAFNWQLTSTYISVKRGVIYGFGAAAAYSIDTALDSPSPGVVKITDGSTGLGSIRALNVGAYETAGTKNVTLSHDGTNGIIQTSAGSLTVGWPSSLGAVGVAFIDSLGSFIGYVGSAGIGLTGSYQLTFGDVGIVRSAAGVVSLTNGSSAGGALSSPALSPATVAADQDNYAPGTARFIRLTTDGSGAKNITGLVAGVDGQEALVINIGTDNIVLKHQSGSSTSTNRFLCPAATDITLAANECASAIYDATTQRWRLF